MRLGPGSAAWVHTVEPGALQVVWSSLPGRSASVHVGDRAVEVDPSPPAYVHHPVRAARRLAPGPTGPGAVVVDGLRAGTSYRVGLRVDGREVPLGEIRTPEAPGPLLARLATMSDLHVGERRFGVAGGIVDAGPDARRSRYPERCFGAALDEAGAWGAELVVLKGDLTARSRVDELHRVRDLVELSGLATVAQPGNHDAYAPLGLEAELGGISVAAGDRLVVCDLPGLRVVVADSAIYRQRQGRLGTARIDAVIDAARDAPHAVLVSLHHPPRRWRVATAYPPGLERPDSRSLLAGLRRANPAAVVIAGHTHRNRTYRIDGVRVAEVGSTKDYPGGWAGYLVHEGGLIQTVRRTSRPDVVAWTEATGRAVGGLWGRWSPGRLDDRAWTERWPRP